MALALASASLGVPSTTATQSCIEMGTAWVCVIHDPAGLPVASLAGQCDAGLVVSFAGVDGSVCITRSAGGGPLVQPPSVGSPGLSLPTAPRTSTCHDGRGLQFTGGVLLGHVCLLFYYGPPEDAPPIDPRTCSAWIDGDAQGDRMVVCPRLAGDVEVPSALEVTPPTVGDPSGPGDPGAGGCSQGFGASASLGGTSWTVCADAFVIIEPFGEPDATLCDAGEVGLIVRLGEGQFGVCTNL